MGTQIGQQYGSYRLVRFLGRGGFGHVYLGEHQYLHTQAAVKLVHEGLTKQAIQAFTIEARTIAALKHPHILRVLEFGFAQGRPYLVTEYAPSGSVRQRYPDGTRLPVDIVIQYVQQVASALGHAHKKRLVHRDVKPENMLLDEEGCIQLADFGIATVAHGTDSMQTVDKFGTVSYMAPEQIEGHPRPESDQYALGVVAYEWLTGVRPFTGASNIEIAMKHLSQTAVPLGQRMPQLSSFNDGIGRALAKDYRQRFPDIQAFAAALVAAHGGKGERVVPTARPESGRLWHYDPSRRRDRVW